MTKNKALPEQNVARKFTFICGDASAALNRRPELLKSFAEQSSVAQFLCPAVDSDQRKVIEAFGYSITLTKGDKQSLNPIADFLYLFRLLKHLRKERPDDVFVFHIKPIMYTAIACRLLGIRCHSLFAGLGFLFSEETSLKRKISKFVASTMLRFGLRRSATVFFQNPDDLETFTKQKIVDQETHTALVNGSGINLTTFPNVPPNLDGPVKFLLVARILRDKGIPEFIEAARKLREKWGDEVEFQILGPFDNNPNAMKQSEIDEAHNEGVIRYLGETKNIKPFLENCSVFVLPSFYMEGTPKIILESLSTGRAVITTDSRGCRETVDDKVNGFLIKPRSVDELIVAENYFVENRQRILDMGQESRKLAESKFDVEKVNSSMLAQMRFQTHTTQESP